jgi:membrane protease YdiL (CAAX protease family)
VIGTTLPSSGFRVELAEVSVFLLQILPPIVLSFFAAGGGGTGATFAQGAFAIMSRDLALVSLIAFFLWQRGETAATLGWRAPRLVREIILGVILFLPVAGAMGVVELLLHRLGVPAPPGRPLPAVLHPYGPAEIALATALVAVVAVAEETIFRGYLVLRFRRLTGGTALALLLSSVIFGLGHAYEGTIGVVTIGFMGLLLALIRLWRGSLAAPVVIHFLQDFLGIVVLPLLSSRR